MFTLLFMFAMFMLGLRILFGLIGLAFRIAFFLSPFMLIWYLLNPRRYFRGF